MSWHAPDPAGPVDAQMPCAFFGSIVSIQRKICQTTDIGGIIEVIGKIVRRWHLFDTNNILKTFSVIQVSNLEYMFTSNFRHMLQF